MRSSFIKKNTKTRVTYRDQYFSRQCSEVNPKKIYTNENVTFKKQGFIDLSLIIILSIGYNSSINGITTPHGINTLLTI